MMLKKLWILMIFIMASMPAFAAEEKKETHSTTHKTTSHHEKRPLKETHTKHHTSKPTSHHHTVKKHTPEREKHHETHKISAKEESKKENKHEPHTVTIHTTKSVEKVEKTEKTEKTENTVPEKHHFLHHYHFHNPHLIKASIELAHTTKMHLVDLVHRAVAALHFSRYRFGGTYFNLSRGIYEVDCSDYVDHLLQMAEPTSFRTLAASMHTTKPTSADYFKFFKNLPDNPISGWQGIDNVANLKAGDILVFRYSDEDDTPGGHVMVVMDKPVPEDNGSTFAVRVSDSASARHSNDTRMPHTSGVGIGTLMLKVDGSGEPSAYAWTLDSGWKSIEAAMAEPVSD